jgi:hypothetical protein|tara:strand:- start:121 stop:702 length:582 start_codon:yes stop_codon:yes gene_type:complete
MNFLKFLRYFLIISLIFSTTTGCKKIDWDGEFEPDGKKRARKNVEEGRGFGGGGLFSKKKGGVFDFASSNELWRASLDTLDFMSFSNVDYSGGLIITDWYSETKNQQSIKITVRFLSNEIRADGLKVTLHQRICGSNNSCAIKEVKSSLNSEIKDRILRKAALLKKAKEDEVSDSIKNEDGEINWCGEGRAIC